MLRTALLAVAGLGLATAASANDLIVNITNIQSSDGEVGCALFSASGNFPTGQGDVSTQWRAADAAGVRCVFENVAPGAYAVSASHDLNGNRETDTNFVGIPREDWGVSNNVRPTLRAPTFDEAQIVVAADGDTTISVELGR